jgi:hypothetical protein
MKIRQWVKNWLFKEDDSAEVPHTISSNRISKSHPSVETDQGFRFTVMPATSYGLSLLVLGLGIGVR